MLYYPHNPYLCAMNQFVAYYKDGLILAGLTLLLFFGFYTIYTFNASITPQQYYTISIAIISFLVVPLYGGYSFYKVFTLSRKKAENATTVQDLMTFREGMRESFIPLFLGGTLSLIVIFIFFNTVGEWAQDALKEGLLDTFIANNDPAIKEEIEKVSDENNILNRNLFSFKIFFTFYPFVLLFYIVISVFFSQFLKKRVY
ncbi:DUF4199 domain-containing protein [Vaginella massiliensis]|uniref:DUF4199 domain-containing protein n=1 Tax=Vaginella massiliensis TaxID=1816680 RepID=UPI000837F49B|nr:DUF4199 domain-containing protein [Vaginella massiliensis]